MKINARQLAATCFILILMFAVKGLRAQESPFLTENLATYLNNELSGDRGFEYTTGRWNLNLTTYRPSSRTMKAGQTGTRSPASSGWSSRRK